MSEGTLAQHVPRAPGIQINAPAIYPNALSPNIIPCSSPGILSTNDTRSLVDRVECTILCAGNILWGIEWEQTNRNPIESPPRMYHHDTEIGG